jgi:hypothetical protein
MVVAPASPPAPSHAAAAACLGLLADRRSIMRAFCYYGRASKVRASACDAQPRLVTIACELSETPQLYL